MKTINENVSDQSMQETKENFSKSLFYIQLISLILAIVCFFLIN
jgi:hypothetical protein